MQEKQERRQRQQNFVSDKTYDWLGTGLAVPKPESQKLTPFIPWNAYKAQD